VNHFDRDGNGTVSYDEFLRAIKVSHLNLLRGSLWLPLYQNYCTLMYAYRAKSTMNENSGSELHMTNLTWPRTAVWPSKISPSCTTQENIPKLSRGRSLLMRCSMSLCHSGTRSRPTESWPSRSFSNTLKEWAAPSNATTTLRWWWRTRGSFEKNNSTLTRFENKKGDWFTENRSTRIQKTGETEGETFHASLSTLAS
jgi:hypothetical protein